LQRSNRVGQSSCVTSGQFQGVPGGMKYCEASGDVHSVRPQSATLQQLPHGACILTSARSAFRVVPSSASEEGAKIRTWPSAKWQAASRRKAMWRSSLREGRTRGRCPQELAHIGLSQFPQLGLRSASQPLAGGATVYSARRDVDISSRRIRATMAREVQSL
jgi:hypothetical protein